jgi:hypothetical protein
LILLAYWALVQASEGINLALATGFKLEGKTPGENHSPGADEAKQLFSLIPKSELRSRPTGPRCLSLSSSVLTCTLTKTGDFFAPRFQAGRR